MYRNGKALCVHSIAAITQPELLQERALCKLFYQGQEELRIVLSCQRNTKTEQLFPINFFRIKR